MPVSFKNLQIGKQYDRPELARIWGYAGFEAISRGVITPRQTPYIILFITHEKQQFLTQYQDTFEDGVLNMEGETNHVSDDRIINAEREGDEIHLFYRARHHMDFTYEGRVYLDWYERHSKQPSRFRLYTEPAEARAQEDIATEEATHGIIDEKFIPDEEGRKILKTHVTYERSARNRAQALKIHGTKCLACGFDFNAAYGPEFARDFIEVHHNNSIAEQGGRPVNPGTDLSPLCSNCHSMAHRQRGKILTVEDLKQLIRRQMGAR